MEHELAVNKLEITTKTSDHDKEDKNIYEYKTHEENNFNPSTALDDEDSLADDKTYDIVDTKSLKTAQGELDKEKYKYDNIKYTIDSTIIYSIIYFSWELFQ